MAIVSVTINGRNFQIACEDGQEAKLGNVVQKLDTKIAEIKNVSPSATTEYLLLLCAISAMAELEDSTPSETDVDHSSKIALASILEDTANDIERLIAKLR